MKMDWLDNPTPALARARLWLLPAILFWLAFCAFSVRLNRHQIWFSNLDQDSIMVIDSLRWRDGRQTTYADHPGCGVYPVYGTVLGGLSAAGRHNAGQFSELERVADPLPAVAETFYEARMASLIVATLLCLAVGALGGLFAGSGTAGLLAFILTLSSCGVLLQSLIVRTELTAMLYLTAGALAAVLASRTKGLCSRSILTWVAGALSAAAVLTKMSVLVLAPFVWLLSAVSERASSCAPQQRWKSLVWLLAVLLLTAMPLMAAPRVLASFYWPMPYLAAGWGVALAAALLFPWWRKLDHPAKTGILWTTIFCAGFLAGLILVFKTAHIETIGNQILNDMMAVFMGKRVGDVSMVTAREAGGLGVIKTWAVAYGGHYLRQTPLLAAFILAFAVGARRLPLFVAGALLSAAVIAGVMSARWFGEHYLVHSDVPLAVAAGAVLWRVLREGRPRYALAVGLLLCANAAIQWAYTKEAYATYNQYWRDRIDYVHSGIPKSPDYAGLVAQHYGADNETIMRHVLADPRLNGANRGIPLAERPNIKKYLDGKLTSDVYETEARWAKDH
jgi:hypothetical protein